MKKRQIAHMAFAAIVLFLCFCSTGCNYVMSHSLSIEDDGTATITTLFSIPMLADSDEIQEMVANVHETSPDVDISTSENDGYITYKFTYTGNLEDIDKISQNTVGLTAPLIQVSNYYVMQSYTIEAPCYQFIPDEEKSRIEEQLAPSMGTAGDYNLDIRLPRKPYKYNGSERGDGYELHWGTGDVFRSDGTISPAKVSFRIIRWGRIALIIVVLMILSGLSEYWDFVESSSSSSDSSSTEKGQSSASSDPSSTEQGQNQASSSDTPAKASEESSSETPAKPSDS